MASFAIALIQVITNLSFATRAVLLDNVIIGHDCFPNAMLALLAFLIFALFLRAVLVEGLLVLLILAVGLMMWATRVSHLMINRDTM